MFPYHASRDYRVRFEHGSRIKCPGFCTHDRWWVKLLRSRPIDSLDASSVFDGRWSSCPYRFAGRCFRVRGHNRHRAPVISYLCRSIELEPRFVCESSLCEYWLGYPLLTSSTVAPEPLFEHLCSSRGSSDGRVSVGVTRATPVGEAPEPSGESWTPLRAILLF